MNKPTVSQLNLLMQFPRDKSYIHATAIVRPSGYYVTNTDIKRLCLKGYITEHPESRWMFCLTDEAITYLNGVKK